jgi:hypothetical protein
VSALAVKLRLYAEDALDFAIVVLVPVVAVVALLAGLVVGIGYLAWYVSVVECDHVQTAMGKPTRLDTWGEGCMVTLDDGTEVPLSNYRVTEEEPARS